MFTDAADCPLSTITLSTTVGWEYVTHFWEGGPVQFTQSVSGSATFSWSRVSLASLVTKPGLPVRYIPAIPEGTFVVVKSATGQGDFSIRLGPQARVDDAYEGSTVWNPEYYDLEAHEYTYHAYYGGGGFDLTETAPGRYTLYTTEPATPSGNEAAVASRNQKTVELKYDDDGKVEGLRFGGSVSLISAAVPETGRPAIYRVTVPDDVAEGRPSGVAGEGHDDFSFTANGTKYEYNSEFPTFISGGPLGGDGLNGWMALYSSSNTDTDDEGNPIYPVLFTAFERRSATVFDVAVASGVILNGVETAYIEGVTGRPQSKAYFSVWANGVQFPDPNAPEGEEPDMFSPPGWFMLDMAINAEIDQFSLSGSWNDDATDFEADEVGEGDFRLTLTLG